MKKLFLIPIVVLFMSVSAWAETENECISGSGVWILPQNIDLREGDQRSPYCQCEQGEKWNGTACLPIPAEILCESSDGVWVNESCECPVQSTGWNDKVGCDSSANIESVVAAQNDSKTEKKGYTSVLALLLLLVFTILIYFLVQKKKTQKRGSS